ncbi:MAG: putative holin [Nitrincola lacisaponensis]|uniref:putative holin n=1 Tax=Nitrincola lacisaponensis TaxID=267850 RepID=UPI00391CFB76
MDKPTAPRLSGLGLIVMLLSLAIIWVSPFQLMVTLYKLSVVTLGGWLGYWLDRWIFPYARPHMVLPGGEHKELEPNACWYMLRRAIIVSATILAVAMGA